MSTANELQTASARIAEIVQSGESTKAGMKHVIDMCRAAYPDQNWSVANAIDYAGDIAVLQAWLEGVLRDEPLDDTIVALWFGLYDTGQGYDLYVCGAETFDPEDPTADWAVSPAYWPTGRFAHSRTLRRLTDIAAWLARDAADFAEYALVLAYGALATAEVLSHVDPRLAKAHAASLGIAVGFDDGDAILLGTITSTGLRRTVH